MVGGPAATLNGGAVWRAGRAARAAGEVAEDLLERLRELYRAAQERLTGRRAPRGAAFAASEGLLSALRGQSAFEAWAHAASELQAVDASRLRGEERLAFWLNVHNALALHACAALGVAHGKSLWRRLEWARSACYCVGGHRFSLLEMEHAVLRAGGSGPRVFGAASLLPSFAEGDPRAAFRVEGREPLLSFGLFAATAGSAPLRVFRAGRARRELEAAAAAYLGERASVDEGRGCVALPELVRYYWSDFAPDGGRAAGVEELARRMPEPLRSRVERCFFDGAELARFRASRAARAVLGEAPRLEKRWGATLRFEPYQWDPAISFAQ